MSVTRRLKRLEAEHAGQCPLCRQSVPAEFVEALNERQREATQRARDKFVRMVEETRERQDAARRREAVKQGAAEGLASAARVRALRSGDVAEVEGADVIPSLTEQERGEPDETAQAVEQFMDEDPLLKILRERREKREQEREERQRARRATPPNNRGGFEDE